MIKENLISSASPPLCLYSLSLTSSIAQVANLGSRSTTSMYFILVSFASIKRKNWGYLRTTEFSKSSGSPKAERAMRTCSRRSLPSFVISRSFRSRVTARGICSASAWRSCWIWRMALRVRRQKRMRWTGCSKISKTCGNLRTNAPASWRVKPKRRTRVSRREIGSDWVGSGRMMLWNLRTLRVFFSTSM